MFRDLSDPSDLWVLPTPNHSNWFSHVDWYLNWQLCKGLAYSGLSLPTQVYRVAEENELQVGSFKTDDGSPLLVLSQGRIPASSCVVLDFEKALKEWVGRAHSVAQKLGAKKVHVFLPVAQSREQAEKLWKSLTDDIQVEFSSDEEALV